MSKKGGQKTQTEAKPRFETVAQSKAPALATNAEKEKAARMLAAFDAAQIGKYAEGQGMAELTKSESDARARMLKNEKKREEAWNGALSMLQKSRAASNNAMDRSDAAMYAIGVAISNMCNFLYSGIVNGVLRGGFKAKSAESALKARNDLKAAQARVDVGGRPFGWAPIPKSVEMKMFYMRRDWVNSKLARRGKAQVMSMSPMEPATMLMGAGLNAVDKVLTGLDPASVYEDFRRVKLNIQTAAREFGHDPIELQSTYVNMMCDSLRCDETGQFDGDGDYIRVGKTVVGGKPAYRVVGYDDFTTVMQILCNDKDAAMLGMTELQQRVDDGEIEIPGLHDLCNAMGHYTKQQTNRRPSHDKPKTPEAQEVSYAKNDTLSHKVSAFLNMLNQGDFEQSSSADIGKAAASVFTGRISELRGHAYGFEQADVDALARMKNDVASGFADEKASDEMFDYGLFNEVHAQAMHMVDNLPNKDARDAFADALSHSLDEVVQEIRMVDIEHRHGLDLSAIGISEDANSVDIDDEQEDDKQDFDKGDEPSL